MPQVSGRVTTPAGAPLAGVPVSAHTADAARGRAAGRAETHTRPDGTWTLGLSPGHWTVREHGHRTHQVHVGSGDVQLAPVETPTPEPGDGESGDLVARLRARRRGVAR